MIFVLWRGGWIGIMLILIVEVVGEEVEVDMIIIIIEEEMVVVAIDIVMMIIVVEDRYRCHHHLVVVVRRIHPRIRQSTYESLAPHPTPPPTVTVPPLESLTAKPPENKITPNPKQKRRIPSI
jgi:hypothetical protein